MLETYALFPSTPNDSSKICQRICGDFGAAMGDYDVHLVFANKQFRSLATDPRVELIVTREIHLGRL
jgi:hypothetical protein